MVHAAPEDRSVEAIEQAHRGGELREQEGKWVPVPIPVSNPTIGSGLQAVLMYLHPRKSENTPNATSGVAAMYTDTESGFVGGFHDDYFLNDKYRLTVLGGYGEFNLDFFGIGGIGLPGGISIPYEFKGGVGSIKALARIAGAKHWYAGLQYLYLDSTITFKTSTLIPYLPDVTGKVKTAALGALLTYDSRDDNYYPNRGQYGEAKLMEFGKTWGGDYEYEKFIGFYNFYIPVIEKLTFAARARAEASNGDTPFFNLAYLKMRGFPRGRYQDQHSLSLHGEVRYKFRPRWGVIGFYEMGWVNDDFRQITSGARVTSIGAGLRWQVVGDKTMNLGIDYAFSTDDQAVYIRIGEAY
jgi:outer membrane protein assembly factor BamA